MRTALSLLGLSVGLGVGAFVFVKAIRKPPCVPNIETLRQRTVAAQQHAEAAALYARQVREQWLRQKRAVG
jgi:hypothetical protein